jgi:hypothetical protein
VPYTELRDATEDDCSKQFFRSVKGLVAEKRTMGSTSRQSYNYDSSVTWEPMAIGATPGRPSI